MKKLLALLLSAALLLSVCAFAEENGPVAHSHRLSDVFLVIDDQIIDLSDFVLELDVSGADGPEAGRVHLDVDGETIAEAGMAALEGDYIVHLESASLGHVDYAIAPVALIAKFLDRGVNGVVQLLQSMDTTELARSIVEALERIGVQPEPIEEEAPAEPAPEMPEITLEGDPLSVLEGCLSAPETVEMGGVEYAPNGTEIVVADGAYTSREFTIDTETLCTVLNMVYLDGEPSGLGDKVRDTGVRFEVNGSFLSGEDEGLNQISSIEATLDTGEIQQSMNLNLNTFYGEDGETTAVTYGLTMGENAMGLSFRLTKGQCEGEVFAPDTIDPDGAIELTDMELEEMFDILGQSLSAVGQDAMGALANSLMEALLADADASAPEAEAAAQ